MTFLNLILLGGAAAAVIPVLIHLFHRSRFKTVPWAAMHLLRASETKKRRTWLEQWLLLAVRAAILVSLALCMARPVLTGMQGLLGDAKTSTVVLLDNSLSMATEESGHPRLARAREETLAVLGALPRGSEMTVAWLAADGTPVLGPTFDPGRVQAGFSTQSGGFGEARPATALQAAIGLLAKSHYPTRELLIVSDFQKANWPKDEQAAFTRALGALGKGPLPPRVTLLPVAREKKDNIAVESVQLSRPLLGVGQPVQVRATVRNWGAMRAADLRVYFRVDGAERSAAQVTLEPGASGQALFSHTFTQAGSHGLEVAVDADALAADNARRVSVNVLQRLPVLLVSDEGGAQQGDTAFLEAALAPYRASGEEGAGPDLVEVKTMSLSRQGEPDLSGVRLVVFVNVPEIPWNWLKPLDAFVRDGGGVLVFPGPRTRPDAWRRLFQDRRYRFLPGYYEKPSGMVPQKNGKIEGKPATIVVEHYNHPALDLFNDPRNGTLGGAELRVWHPLKTDGARRPVPNERKDRAMRRRRGEEQPAPEGETVTLARLDSGGPFLIEKQYGRGRVMLCAAACDDRESNLPAKPCYLPLMQQLATSLAAPPVLPRTLQVGQPIAAVIPFREELDLAEDQPESDVAALVTDPADGKHELKANLTEAGEVFSFDQTMQPGMYGLTLERLPAAGQAAGAETIRFAVNTPPAESDPALLERGEIEALAKSAGVRLIDSAGQYLSQERQRRYGSELWKPLLALVLALVFFEILLEQRLARRAS